MRRGLLILALALGLVQGGHAQTVQPGQPAPTAEAEAKALVLAAGLRNQLLESMPAMAEGLRQHLNQQNPGREDDVRRAVETAIVPAVTARLDELIDAAVQPLVRGPGRYMNRVDSFNSSSRNREARSPVFPS